MLDCSVIFGFSISVSYQQLNSSTMVVNNFVAGLDWEWKIFNGSFDDLVNSFLKLATSSHNHLHFHGSIFLFQRLPSQVQENANDENYKTAVDRELEGGRDIDRTVIRLVNASLPI